MSTAPTRSGKRESLNLRIRADERNLIDRAAMLRGKNRTDFVLEAARKSAEEALLEQALVAVTPAAYARFLDRLDTPPQSNRRLRKTLRAKPPWAQS